MRFAYVLFLLTCINFSELSVLNGYENKNLFSPVLEIEDGQIMGRMRLTVGKYRPYFSFEGIPYAKPPLGNLRFKAPERNEKWSGVLNATTDRNSCHQAFRNDTSEDCLYINVYTTDPAKKNQQVLVWIYGGGFLFGTSDYTLYGPDYFIEEDVIFVSFNYRLGVFGFLSTGDLECPGNWGLKDQVMALEWVQRNIEYFGGNPKDVTIFGESAGAASAAYLLQTEKTKGLFKAAIMDSGSSLCLWALNRKAKQIAFNLGRRIGVNQENSTLLLENLRKLEDTELQVLATSVELESLLENVLDGLPMSPVIEPEHEGAVLSEKSHHLLSQGKFHQVPILMGVNSNEAAALGEISIFMRCYLEYYDLNYKKLAPSNLTENEELIAEAAKEIKRHYFGTMSMAIATEPVIQFCSDDQFNRPIKEAVKLYSKYTPVYFYRFSYAGALSAIQERKLPGVGHAEELFYMFRTYSNCSVPESDFVTRSRMVRMWSNFAKYSNPTPVSDELLENITWIPAGSSDKLVYLDINTNLTIQAGPNKENMEFYDEIYKKYGQPPYATY